MANHFAKLRTFFSTRSISACVNMKSGICIAEPLLRRPTLPVLPTLPTLAGDRPDGVRDPRPEGEFETDLGLGDEEGYGGVDDGGVFPRSRAL